MSNAQQLTSKTYDNLGKIHNQALDNFLRNFKEQKVSNLDEGVDYINSIHSNFYNSLSLSNNDKTNLVENSNKFKYFVVENSFYNYLYSNSNAYSKLTTKAKESIDKINKEANITSQNPALSQIIQQASQNGLIDSFEKDKLNEINNLVSENKAGRITITELKEKMNNIAVDFDSKKYDLNGKNGHLLAQTLSIGINSIDWWIANGDVFINSETSGGKGGPSVNFDYIDNSGLLAPWVGADIVGAVYGGTVGAIGSYTTTGSVNWGAAGISAVGGAVAGSTGIIGKAGKWLSSLF
jgi:hypothetical protein